MRPLLCCAAALLAAAALPAAATAGKPGTWTRVTPTTGANIDQVSLARGSDNVLNVVWQAKNVADPTGKQDVAAARIDPAGNVGPETPVERGWSAISNPAITVIPQGLLTFF